MPIIREFREFAVRGNVLDLAVGVIIGGAFGKIVNSLVNDLVMPPIGWALQGVSFRDLRFVLGRNAEGEVISAVNYGNFFQVSVEFVVIAITIFFFVKAVNRFRRKQDEVVKKEEKQDPAEDIVLLREIRDALKKG